MGTLVNMKKKENVSILRGKKYGVLPVMPELMVDFAERSRADDGYRLLKQAARHATGPTNIKFYMARVALGSYINHMCVMIQHNNCHASMKVCSYTMGV
jgi:hypothetical protein